MNRTNLSPTRAHTALMRLYIVENTTSTPLPRMTRTASSVIHIPLVTHCDIMYFSRLYVPSRASPSHEPPLGHAPVPEYATHVKRQ